MQTETNALVATVGIIENNDQVFSSSSARVDYNRSVSRRSRWWRGSRNRANFAARSAPQVIRFPSAGVSRATFLVLKSINCPAEKRRNRETAEKRIPPEYVARRIPVRGEIPFERRASTRQENEFRKLPESGNEICKTPRER